MEIGLSTACFYPLETEKSLRSIGELDVHVAEIFTNCYSELSPSMIAKLRAIMEHYDIRISSVHPFTSFTETNFLFSDYERRFWDTVELYKKFSEFAGALGAKWLILHGPYPSMPISMTQFAERYQILYDACREYGVSLAQENVVHCASENISFLQEMSCLLTDCFHLVLDIKQALRAKTDPFSYISHLGSKIVHLHLSDHNQTYDCLPPGEGIFDFRKLFQAMRTFDYQGDGVIELYSRNWSKKVQLFSSVSTLRDC